MNISPFHQVALKLAVLMFVLTLPVMFATGFMADRVAKTAFPDPKATRVRGAERGFAIVASEVRTLTQCSLDAASQIGALIEARGVHVETGLAMVRDTGHAVQSVGTFVLNMSDDKIAIAASDKEQSRAISKVNTSVADIDPTTQDDAAMFEQTSATSRIVLTQSNALMTASTLLAIHSKPTDKIGLKAVG